jgi:hypothetical protein
LLLEEDEPEYPLLLDEEPWLPPEYELPFGLFEEDEPEYPPELFDDDEPELPPELFDDDEPELLEEDDPEYPPMLFDEERPPELEPPERPPPLASTMLTWESKNIAASMNINILCLKMITS